MSPGVNYFISTFCASLQHAPVSDLGQMGHSGAGTLPSLGAPVTAAKGGSFMCKCEFLQSFALPGKVNMVACEHNASERVERVQAPTFEAVMTKSAS